jgi:hypothetical protein
MGLQDAITRVLVAAIDPAISQVEQERVMRKPPENLSAREAWQRALWHWAKRDFPGTRDALERTVRLDSRFAPAYAVLSWARISEVARGIGPPWDEAMRLAEQEARTAVDLDPGSSIAHAILALVFSYIG